MIITKDHIFKNETVLSLISYFILFTSSLLLGFYLLGGFQVGFSVPLSYTDDGLFVLVYVKLLLMGEWNLSSQNLAYPFGMNLCDFPGSDFGNRAFFVFLSLFTKDPVVAFNLYAYLSFPITTCATFFVSKKIGLTKVNSFVLSSLFAFSTFSMQRLIHFGHLVYMCNFVVPIFFYLGYLIYNYDVEEKADNVGWKKLILTVLLLILLSSFGVYYAYFGCLVMATSGILGSVRFCNWRNFLISMVACCAVFIGFLINMLPTVINSVQNGKNNEIAIRNAGETDIYGLRLTQMLVPHSDHRLKLFRNINKKYTETFTFTSTNGTPSLGLIGSCGFLISIFFVLFFSSWNNVNLELKYFSVIGVVLFLYATVGGFGASFSFLITPIFRGVNRVGIFISLSSLFVLFLILQNSFLVKNKQLFIFGLLFFGLYDQTFKVSSAYHSKNRSSYLSGQDFVKKIENLFPGCNKVFQYPYMSFPEAPQINSLDSYGLAIGFIHSNFTYWNYGAIKGRVADDFFKVLVEQDFNTQFEVIKKLGFTGIFIDRRGFVDHGVNFEAKIESFFGLKPTLVSSDNNRSFFKIADSGIFYSGIAAFEIMQKVGFKIYRDNLGLRFEDENVFTVDFSKLSMPSFIKSIKGFSVREDWGIWTDALLLPNAEIEFNMPFPNEFTLILEARSFVDYSGKSVKLKIGNTIKDLVITPNLSKYEIHFNIKENLNKLEIIVPFSVSPNEIGVNVYDRRKLGIGLSKLTILK